MNFRLIKIFGSVLTSSLLLGSLGVFPSPAYVGSRAEQETLLSLHQRVDKSFTCGGELSGAENS
ncbi:hypothetical protein HC928_10270 [bacterium]|nr:hypothetical protein [bacterium]